MTYEFVDVGAAPDDGNGDPLRTAYIKINNNFANLQQVGTDRITNGLSNVIIPVANGNIYMGVANVANIVTVTSNGVIATRVSTTGNVIAGQYFLGNGYFLTDISTARSISYGTSAVEIPSVNGNINSVVQGNLTLQASPNLVTVFGDFNVTGNATIAGNITRNAIAYGTSFLGFDTPDGNAFVTIAGTSNVAVFTTSGLNVTGAIGVSSTVSAAGNVTGGNFRTGGLLSATGNVTGSNVNTAGVVTASGNVTGNNVIGNQGVYGNIFTTLIDSGDSSQITVTPDVRFSATVTVDNELDADFILSQRINTSIISASGNVLGPIPSVSNTFYVAKNGSDSNNGGLNTPFLTIKAACTAATALGGNVSIRIASGTYVEQTPITVPPNTAIMGDNLRTVTIKPATPANDLFYMTNGTYVWGITVKDYLGAAFAYDPATPGQNVFVSPYIQNITSSTTTGTGCRIDGSLVSSISTKAMILGFYTIINRGGIGVDLLNSAYSQAVNIYTISCDIGLRTRSGSFVTLNGSDCSIGNYGLVSEGIGPLQTSGNTVGYSTAGTFVIDGLSNGQPHVNTVMVINDADYVTTSSTSLTIAVSVVSLTIGTSLSYSVGQDVIIAYDSITFMTGEVQSYDSGTGALVVDVTDTNGSGTYSSWDVNLFPITYYTIDTISPNTPSAGNATVLIQETFAANLVPGTNLEFYTRSAIIASAHTFEYVGAGTNPATALPQYGGIPVPENEVVTVNGGVVTFTSTDQKGNFRVGKGFTVNQATGTVSGDDFYRSLFAIMTPYILALQEVP
jgi:hypothetical protein